MTHSPAERDELSDEFKWDELRDLCQEYLKNAPSIAPPAVGRKSPEHYLSSAGTITGIRSAPVTPDSVAAAQFKAHNGPLLLHAMRSQEKAPAARTASPSTVRHVSPVSVARQEKPPSDIRRDVSPVRLTRLERAQGSVLAVAFVGGTAGRRAQNAWQNESFSGSTESLGGRNIRNVSTPAPRTNSTEHSRDLVPLVRGAPLPPPPSKSFTLKSLYASDYDRRPGIFC
mmetsp:Transcript_2880/g.7094  ORF Transcript_2880/g.7094 Transcript_2880/m.7094 type:complete len:228 (-) Transcript_2880:149-832(-)